MRSIKDLLEQEMKESLNYSQRNFGQQVGDGYPEMVREVASSTYVSASLLVGMLSTALFAPNFAKEAKEGTGEETEKITKAIMNNVMAFETPLSLLYWGIRVGRKLQQEEDNIMKNLENSLGEGK